MAEFSESEVPPAVFHERFWCIFVEEMLGSSMEYEPYAMQRQPGPATEKPYYTFS